MAVWSAVTWRRNTAHEAGSAVAIRRLTGRDLTLLVLATAAVTALFGWLLAALDTPNPVSYTHLIQDRTAHPAGSPGGIQLVKKVPLDFFAKLLPELQNQILQHDFAILPLRRVI